MSEQITQMQQAFCLRGRLYTLTVLQLLQTDLTAFETQLQEAIAQAPKLFDKIPLVFDLSAVKETACDLTALIQAARKQQVFPIAIQGGSALHESLAQAQGLALMHASSHLDKKLAAPKTKSHPKAAVMTSKLLTSPVRSGQQIVVRGGDLVVTAAVGQGAEVLADGSIHIYGVLRGRALAGLSGDKNARIYCQSLEAELVSIAGFFQLSESLPKQMGPCQIFLKDEHIQIARL